MTSSCQTFQFLHFLAIIFGYSTFWLTPHVPPSTNIVIEYDYCLRSHFDFMKKNANGIFSRLLSDIQNGIINYRAAIVESEIKPMIEKHHLWLFDETMDPRMKFKFSSVLRFVDERKDFLDTWVSRKTEELKKFRNLLMDLILAEIHRTNLWWGECNDWVFEWSANKKKVGSGCHISKLFCIIT